MKPNFGDEEGSSNAPQMTRASMRFNTSASEASLTDPTSVIWPVHSSILAACEGFAVYADDENEGYEYCFENDEEAAKLFSPFSWFAATSVT